MKLLLYTLGFALIFGCAANKVSNGVGDPPIVESSFVPTAKVSNVFIYSKNRAISIVEFEAIARRQASDHGHLISDKFGCIANIDVDRKVIVFNFLKGVESPAHEVILDYSGRFKSIETSVVEH